ncbi:hypothetical protein D3C75_804910 [compost metagenome]
MVFSHTMENTMPSAPMTTNTCSQPKLNTIQPMIGANSAVAKYCAELKIADAVPRSAVGNQAATMRALPGNDGASAKPTRKRRVNKVTTAQATGRPPTKPCSRVNSDQVKMLKA